ncbi:MAG: transglutaminase domain-containing protein, partial [Clostridiaceae bacterium]|nr:transglutaminase domain-containing protein [Clostridiaceae bacterium]
YYPLQNRLGGSVSLSSDPVFSVTGPISDMLFKGAVSMNYNGSSWERLPMNEAMGFNDPMYFQARENILGISDLFDMSGPLINSMISIDGSLYTEEELEELQNNLTAEGYLNGGIIESKTYDVEFTKQGFRSVFYHGSPMDISLDLESDASLQGFDLFSELIEFDPTLYFNDGGAIYTTTPFSPGQGYRVVAMDRIINENSFSYWYNTFYGIDTSGLDFNAEDIASSVGDRRYLQLPDLPEYRLNGSLSVLARELTADKKNQYDRAKAIEEYLMNAAEYSLRVEIPPADREFVSWFLEQKEGYCVYFATALTMLCRSAGIPARYVEGYYIPSGSDVPRFEDNELVRKRVITGQEAHAWTEVYIEGMGWMTFDATPGGGTAAAIQIEQDRINPYPIPTAPTSIQDNGQNTNNRNEIQDPSDDWSAFFKRVARDLLPFAIVILLAIIVILGLRLWILRLRRLFEEKWWLAKESSVRLRINLLLTAILRLLPEHNRLWENGQVWSDFAENSRHYIFSISNGTIDAHEWEKASRIFNEALYSNHEMKEKQWHLAWHIFSSMIQGLLEKKSGRLRTCLKLLPMLPLLRK